MDIFSDEVRRDPYPTYERIRSASPVLHVPPPFDLWLILDYEGVRRALGDQQTFSSAVPGPRDWFIFFDPPRHTRFRALIAKAFTPRVIVDLEPQIRALSRQLLDQVRGRGEMDLAGEYAVPLPMMVIAQMIGIPMSDWARFRRWSDSILKLSYTMRGMDGGEAIRSFDEFTGATAEMDPYLKDLVAARHEAPQDDLLTRLIQAEVDGQRLSHNELLGFFQLLVVGGQETTANLINNAILCLLEHPDQLALLRQDMGLLPPAIEEVLRYRSPLQWVMRTPRRDVEVHGQTIPAGKLVLVMLGSANRDPRQFDEPDRFDIRRDPNPHLAFGHGNHFCMGATLSRLEARVALTDLLSRMTGLARAGGAAWEPRKALHVHGPSRLSVKFDAVGE